ncbi:MAG TPA: SRPBCC family protein [Spongiibacteraceae bacterium]
MLKITGSIIVAIIVVILILAATKPDNFVIQRSLAIKAPPEKIYPLIADFHHWTAWSPYEKLDPSLQRTFSGAESGRGAIYEWSGNKKAGKGRMEIIETKEPNDIVIQLDFIEPFAAHNTAEFTLTPNGDSTTATWAMRGTSPFIAKIMQVFFNMDKMIGPDFETGLANLKAATEQ